MHVCVWGGGGVRSIYSTAQSECVCGKGVIIKIQYSTVCVCVCVCVRGRGVIINIRLLTEYSASMTLYTPNPE